MQHFLFFQPACQVVQPNKFSQRTCSSTQRLLEIISQQSTAINQLRKQVRQLRSQMDRLSEKLDISSPNSQQISENELDNKKIRRKNFSSKFQCCYANCQKNYGSSLALNLHIKQKHNGGTKKQRQAYAKLIFSCEQKGIQPPEIQCNFPPGFLQEQRKKLKKKTMY